jgi:hypothetical protein
MTDFRPGDYRSVAARQRSTGPWLLLGLVLVLLGGGAWVYLFRPQWIAQVHDLASVPRSIDRATPGDKTETDFGALYRRYGISPLAAGVAGDDKINALLASLQKEPCDK